MIYGAFIYIIAIKGMVFKYISLVSEGLTIKEKMSRIATCQTYGIKDEIKMNLTRGQKFKNLLFFIFKKKSHKSTLP